MAECNVPRCHETALRSWPMCFDHAIADADRKIAEAESLRKWLVARRTGQLGLLEAS